MDQWTVPLEWNGGIEYWNEILVQRFMSQLLDVRTSDRQCTAILTVSLDVKKQQHTLHLTLF